MAGSLSYVHCRLYTCSEIPRRKLWHGERLKPAELSGNGRQGHRVGVSVVRALTDLGVNNSFLVLSSRQFWLTFLL